ncbi:MAG: TatD family hydrolase [Candidatus Aminicenantes bacterium]|nr:TatD family hydrolase [Candidatus Aminicenantes bacterium]
MLVDSHAHLDMEDFDGDRKLILERAEKAGVKAILCPFEISSSSSRNKTLALCRTQKNIFAAGGVHPHQASQFREQHRKKLIEMAKKGTIHAIGEIGLDFFYNYSLPDIQRKVFREQLILAEEVDLPVIIHSRNAGPDVCQIVRETQFTRGGVLHCFSEDETTANHMLEEGFYISFSGILTFPKAQSVRDIAAKIPMERLLVETDSPYLTPVPFRGKIKRNEPAYVVETARVLAGLRKMPFKNLADQTTLNFKTVFAIEIKVARC